MQEVSFDQRVLARTGYVDIGGKNAAAGRTRTDGIIDAYIVLYHAALVACTGVRT